MKIYQTFFLLLAVTCFTACQRDKIREFIPGTYINSAGGIYSRANDTLIVKPLQNNQFHIARRTGFNLIQDGKTGKRQFETEVWKAVYDEGTRSLTETRKGKLITAYPDSGFLLIGKRKYIKK